MLHQWCLENFVETALFSIEFCLVLQRNKARSTFVQLYKNYIHLKVGSRVFSRIRLYTLVDMVHSTHISSNRIEIHKIRSKFPFIQNASINIHTEHLLCGQLLKYETKIEAFVDCNGLKLDFRKKIWEKLLSSNKF